jgi:2-amino-4-hydroxy-6-hydroxymethyldihydropteridine diphosphokinase/dihydropteroate synthase
MFMLGPRELIVGLGSNSVDAISKLREARRLLRAHPELVLLRCSPIYESDALLPDGAPSEWNLPYLNAACVLATTRDLSAEEVISVFKSIERRLGRVEAPRWAPRPIDLDLLAWSREDLATGPVRVPHPGLLERPFALLPALDCAGTRDEGAWARAWRFAHPAQVPHRTRLSQAAWPELVGILNVTPDSFSHGDPGLDEGRIHDRALQLIRDGASVIDVGAESTRPGATLVTSTEEISRLERATDALTRLKRQHAIEISLDSRHPETVEWALERGLADWVNDVEGFTHPGMIELAARSDAKLVVMHSLGVPPAHDVTLDPAIDPVEKLLIWGRDRIRTLAQHRIAPSRIVIDPGIGFGKTAAQNVTIVAKSRELARLNVALLLGYSRKRFMDPEGAIPAADRDLETAIMTSRLGTSCVDYLRVHSPSTQRRALQLGARLA